MADSVGRIRAAEQAGLSLQLSASLSPSTDLGVRGHGVWAEVAKKPAAFTLTAHQGLNLGIPTLAAARPRSELEMPQVVPV